MKTPIERITDYINDPDTATSNPIEMLKELRARIHQDNINQKCSWCGHGEKDNNKLTVKVIHEHCYKFK